MSGGTVFPIGITTLTNVTSLSLLAYDIRDIDTHLQSGDHLNARRIYDEGWYSKKYNHLGQELEELLTLKSLGRAGIVEIGEEGLGGSLDGGYVGVYDEDPSFVFQMLGMTNVGEDLEESISKNAAYADNFISQQLNDETIPNDKNLGAQASVILTVQMYAMHKLWDGVLDCIQISNGYNPLADTTGSIDPKHSFDSFIALYVGSGQTLGPEWDGDMLYEHAQVAGKHFQTIDDNGEAWVNYSVRKYYQSLQQYLSEDNYCMRDEAIENIWSLVNRITASMYVPHFQMLIRSMYEEDQLHKVRMYALSVVPQLSQCRPSIYRRLKSYLLDKDYDRADFERVLGLLQQTYDCLGFGCDDVGSYGSLVAECAGFDLHHPMAGFVPSANVRTLSKADLDIHAISELLKFPSSTNNKMAQLYYKYGRAAVIDADSIDYDVLSLQDMALTNNIEKWSPYYQDYVDYHKKVHFAHLEIMDAFNGEGKWGTFYDDGRRLQKSSNQRSAFIVSMMQYHVAVEYMMSLLGMAQNTCEDGTFDSYDWDSFAALYIGSLEGIELGGSDETIDGVFLWNTANKRAVQFNTQNEDHYAIVNDEMLQLLFSGQRELDRFDCTNFEKSTSRVLHLMFVPLIQSSIWYAIRSEDESHHSTHEDLAIAEALALSLLPVVAKYDPEAADVIEKNVVRVYGIDPVSSGAQTVANAYYQILDEIGWGCEYIGHAEGVTCQLYSPTPVKSKVDSAAAIFKPGAIVSLSFVLFSWWMINAG